MTTIADKFAEVSAAIAARVPSWISSNGALRWLVTFLALCALVLAVALVMLWAVGAFIGPGLTGHVLIALCLAVTFMCGVGVALMALIFYSARADYDEDAFRAGRP